MLPQIYQKYDMNSFFYFLKDFFEATFEILPILGNIPNVIFTLIVVAITGYWINELIKYKRLGQE